MKSIHVDSCCQYTECGNKFNYCLLTNDIDCLKFTIGNDINDFINIFDKLQIIFDEITMNFDYDNNINVVNFSDDKRFLFVLRIDVNKFDEFECKKNFSFHLKTKDFLEILRTKNADKITFKYQSNQKKLLADISFKQNISVN